MEGGIPQEYFFGPKTLEWKGRCEQEHCHGEETNHFEKAGGIFSEVFPLIALNRIETTL
jgi:hypothetical protein